MAVRVDESLDGIDWVQAKADLAADDFDNGRSPQALRASFEQSQHVAIAWDGDRVVGMARLLSDGVCNAYLLDVWTMSAYRRQGIGTTMVRQLMSRVPGQHIGLQTEDAEAFYASLGYHHQPVFMSAVVGEWLANEANARLRAGVRDWLAWHAAYDDPSSALSARLRSVRSHLSGAVTGPCGPGHAGEPVRRAGSRRDRCLGGSYPPR
jgi:GNAT superfamily N-acetyltransferase